MNSTLHYYDEMAQSFSAGTRDVDFEETRKKFTDLLPDAASVLDLGCGSGRDAKAFLEMGLDVEAMDGSMALCKLASDYLGIPVINQTFLELDEDEKYDGIWACASLLHVDKEEIGAVLKRITKALKSGGILYCSFKYGDFCGFRHERFFCDYQENSFENLVKKHPKLQILEMWQSTDVRKERKNERWLNVLLQKQ